jgi:ferric-dicitrate binding protein FerR (iron transport regulator)
MTDADATGASAQNPAGSDALERIIRAAGRRPAPGAADYERVRLTAHLAWQMKVHASRRRKRVWWALAAGVVLTIAIAGTTLPLRVPPAVAELAVARGGVERFVPDDARWEALPSGAQLDAGARLRTSPDGGAAFVVLRDLVVRADGATEWIFDDATHLTLTGGTLYVDTGSAGSAGRALQIVTPHGVVRHVGTQYEVRALSSELRVRVREGRVQLEPRAAGPARETAAGEELLLMADGAVALRPFAADSPERQWAEALAVPIDVDGGTAFAALQWVARETGRRLIFEDANAELLARNAIIHGSSAGLEPLQLLDVVMATSAGLDYALGDGTLVVRRR